MNAIEGDAISTIHVTPEDGFSYASFEAAGYDFEEVNLRELLERVLACFKPAEFSVALHTGCVGAEVSTFRLNLKGYKCEEMNYKVTGEEGGTVIYYNFVEAREPVLKCRWRMKGGERGIYGERVLDSMYCVFVNFCFWLLLFI